MCARFPGAAVELSDSGHGLHIWGCGTAPEHSQKERPARPEFYTELRFILLGRQAVSGNGRIPHYEAELAALVHDYFPPGDGDRRVDRPPRLDHRASARVARSDR
jgi:primase-polymerase (primpol)-like protein